MTAVDPTVRAVAVALWDRYGYTLPDGPEAIARLAVDTIRASEGEQ